MELLAPARTFIVRVTAAGNGEIAGTVEQVRTGERQRFQRLKGLGVLVAQMMAEEPDEGGKTRRAE